MTAIDLGVPSLGPAEPAPVSGPLIDTFGRIATDLRVSLTDRCNLRCTYCMPAEGLDWLPKPDVLTHDEVVRLVGIGVARLAGPLRQAGLDRVNVSLDTLRPETFRELSHRDRLPDVLAGLAAATA